MKFILAVSMLLTVVSTSAHAGWVKGHLRKNGTYVNGYHRTDSDSTVMNNYSYPGNYNPNSQPAPNVPNFNVQGNEPYYGNYND